MRDPEQFDAFYAAARHRVLLQAFALTGDLSAAKRAVRDGFIEAWHHWHKVSRQDEPEAWVRPRIWQHAQRRHTAHFWHRDRSLDSEHRATLDALDELGSVQRRALLLKVLAGLDAAAFGHEIGLSADNASRQLKLAAAQFAIHRDIELAEVPATLAALATPLQPVRLPRASIVRRAGTARRRAHTSAAIAATAALALGAGFAVSHDSLVTASVQGERGGDAPRLGTPDSVVHLDTARLLQAADLAALAPQPFTEAATGNNTAGTGLNLPCQRTRFADPKAVAALVRDFTSTAPKPTAAVQVVERSRDDATAMKTYAGTLAWFSDCQGKRLQLLGSWGLGGAGDQGAVLVLRDWAEPVTTWTIGVARTGSIVTTLARSVGDKRAPDLPPFVAAVGQSVTNLCTAEGGHTCPTAVTTTPSAPAPGPSAQGLLQVVDLPPTDGTPLPWVGTDPKRADLNPAATTCDRADFEAPATTWSATRTFLMPGAQLPTRFGLSETVGRFAGEAEATAFMAGVEKRMKTCEDRDLSARVEEIRHQPKGEVHAWKLTTEVSTDRSITFWMAVVRRGPVVAQIGFVPVSQASFGQEGFKAVVERALARLDNLPPT